jgi:hypothetical protein
MNLDYVLKPADLHPQAGVREAIAYVLSASTSWTKICATSSWAK